MEQRPDVGQPVILRDHLDREYASRVHDLGSGLLVVTQPSSLPTEGVPGTGAELDVVWTDSEGVVAVLPTRLLVAHAAGSVPVWSLSVTGPAHNEQRRRSERAPAEGSVLVRAAAGEAAGALRGRLVDVSEGGVRCTVAAGAADRFLMGQQQVVAEFRLGDVDFALPGRVEFLRPTAHPAQLEELVVVFEQPVVDAAVLHAQVLARHVQSLESGDDGDAP